MELIKSSPELITHLRRSGESNTKLLTLRHSNTIFGLESLRATSGEASLKLLSNDEPHEDQQAIEPFPNEPPDRSTKHDAQPTANRLLSGFIFLLVQLLVIAAFSALYSVSVSQNGLLLPTTATSGSYRGFLAPNKPPPVSTTALGSTS
jgi:hypothetical protein